MKFNLRKGEKGITLIALVITIVILLILAGVALNIALGDNGIFKKSKDSGERYTESSAREQLELALTDLQMEKETNSAYNDTAFIDSYLTDKGMTINDELVVVDGYLFEIDRDKLIIVDSMGKDTGERVELTIRYYLENTNDTNYTCVNTTTRDIMPRKIKLANYATTIQGGKYTHGSLTENGAAETETTITQPTTIYLYYSANTYELKINKVENETGIIASISGAGNYKAGQNVNLIATMETAQTGYDYTFKWKDGTGDLGSSLTYTYTMPANDVEIIAEASKTIKTFTVTCEDREGSSTGKLLGTSAETKTYNYGDIADAAHWEEKSYGGYNHTGNTSVTVTQNTTVYRLYSVDLSTAETGTEVTYGGESFYKIGTSDDETKVVLLAKSCISSGLQQVEQSTSYGGWGACATMATDYGNKFGNGVVGRLPTKSEMESIPSSLRRNKK